jgi:thiol:disulfide interchange protein
VVALRLVTAGGGIADHLLLLGSLVTAVLLALPAAGSTGAPAPRAALRRPPEIAAAVGVAILLVAAAWAARASAPPARGALPASAIARGAAWVDYGAGLEQARRERKPLLLTFVTSWCPYCRKMATTWRAGAVVERLAGVVPVKIDAEDTRASGGVSGVELAARYQVSGYPVQLLIAPDGRVLARADGYQTPAELVGWLDRALPRPGATGASAARNGGS